MQENKNCPFGEKITLFPNSRMAEGENGNKTKTTEDVMESQTLQHRIDQLNQRIRILILQNAREQDEFDDEFLCQIKELADEVLRLRNRVRHFERQFALSDYSRAIS